MNELILSNNPSLEDSISGIPVRKIDGGIAEIYEAISNSLQNGFELVTSPLPPNVPLIRSPIRSVLLRPIKHKYDAKGLLALERARERTEVLGVKYDERTRKDLEFIDRDHLLRAISQLREMGSPMTGQQC